MNENNLSEKMKDRFERVTRQTPVSVAEAIGEILELSISEMDFVHNLLELRTETIAAVDALTEN